MKTPKAKKTKKVRSPRATKRPRREGTGIVPPGILATWNARGYLTVAQAAEKAGVARTTVYGWVKRGVLRSPLVGLEPVTKDGPFVWLLAVAVEAIRPPPPPAAAA